MLREPGEAEDALQETFLQVWRQAGRYDSDRSTPRGWLVMIARSRALDRLRRRPATTEPGHSQPSAISTLDGVAERDETAAAVHRALGQLPTDQRAAIEMAFYEGLSYTEVAGRLGVPVGTAKTRIRLGMIKLRKILGPTEGPA